MKKYLISIMIVLTVVLMMSTVYANNSWWNNAHGFISGYEGEDTILVKDDPDTKEDETMVIRDIMDFMSPLVRMVRYVGNTIFFAVTVVLGVKYIWGSVESKASVKDSMITLVVAALVFYSWDTISNLFMEGNKLNFISGQWQATVDNVYSIILYVCNFLAVGGLVYIGVRYMMAGAEGRSQLKAKSVTAVLGIIMVYATLSFMNLITSLI